MNPRREKKVIRRKIMAVMERDKEADVEVLKSSFKLETGFSDKIISEIIKDLINIGMLERDNGKIFITKKGIESLKGNIGSKKSMSHEEPEEKEEEAQEEEEKPKKKKKKGKKEEKEEREEKGAEEEEDKD